MVAVAATLAGSGAAAHWMFSAASMQGLTLVMDVVSIGLIALLAWWQTRRARGWLRPPDYRRVYGRAFYRLGIWGLGGYMAYMLIGTAILNAVGFHYLK